MRNLSLARENSQKPRSRRPFPKGDLAGGWLDPQNEVDCGPLLDQPRVGKPGGRYQREVGDKRMRSQRRQYATHLTKSPSGSELRCLSIEIEQETLSGNEERRGVLWSASKKPLMGSETKPTFQIDGHDGGALRIRKIPIPSIKMTANTTGRTLWV